MEILRQVVVLDAADLDTESTFWARMLDGTVQADEDWHAVMVDGRSRLAVQLAPDHTPPDWPGNAVPQQVHLDLVVPDIRAAHEEALAHGARLLEAADLDQPSGFQVYADPAGHPFCLCWQ